MTEKSFYTFNEFCTLVGITADREDFFYFSQEFFGDVIGSPHIQAWDACYEKYEESLAQNEDDEIPF